MRMGRRVWALLFMALGASTAASVLASATRAGTLPSFLRRETAVRSQAILPEQGFAHYVYTHRPALSAHERPSLARLLENGRPLGPGNAQHDDVRRLGGGRYSFWHDYVLFAASDNTDPATNGRIYAIDVPFVPVSPRVERALWLLTAALALVLAGLARTWRLLPRIWVWATRRVALLAGRVRALDRRLSTASSWRGVLMRATVLAVPVLAYAAIAFGELPLAITAPFRNHRPSALLISLLVLYLPHRVPGRLGFVCALAATLSLLALPLSAAWHTAPSDGSVIGGLLPWSDASGYYQTSQLILEGSPLRSWMGRRPWFAGLLASVLAVTGGDLKWALVLLVALTGVAIVLLAGQVKAIHGALAAAVSSGLLLAFYGRFVTATLTEHLGLALGALGLAVLARGASQPSPGPWWPVGLWLLATALLARAGPFFVLPALLLWAAFRYRGLPRRKRVQVLAAALAAVGMAFLLDFALRRTLYPGAEAFGNLAHTVYGVVAGNRGWSQVLVDHPEVTRLAEAEAARRIHGWSIDALRADPLRAVAGVWGAYRDYFSLAGPGAFGFVHVKPAARVSLFVLSGLGLVTCWRRRRSGLDSMLLAMAAGILASVPLVPPVDADSMRAYAATLPMSAWLAGLGAASLLPKGRHVEPTGWPEARVAAAFGAMVVLVSFAGPFVIRAFKSPRIFMPSDCAPGQRSLHMPLSKGSHLALIEDDARRSSHVPEVRVTDFRAGLQQYAASYPALAAELQQMQPGQELRYGIDLSTARHGHGVYLISDRIVHAPGDIAQVCATPTENASLRPYAFYHARQVLIVSSQGR